MKKIVPGHEGSQHARADQETANLPDVVRTKSGELIVWAPLIKSEIRPMITLGRFRDGTPAIHFRRYRVRPDGIAVMLAEGASYRVDEIVEGVDHLRAMFEAIPSLRASSHTGAE